MNNSSAAGEQADRMVAAREESGRRDRTIAGAGGAGLAALSRHPGDSDRGARRMSQLQDNLASLTLELSENQVAELNAASAIELGFPHDFYKLEMVKGMIYGGMRDRILA